MKRGALTAVVAASLAAGLLGSTAAAQAPEAPLLRIPFPKYDGTLTPYSFEIGYPLVTLVYDTLLWRDAKGVPQPWLARSVARSNGGRRVTVRLREGVRWHDGRRVSAGDVVFTFEYVARRSSSAPELANVEQVQAVDPLTVAFDLRRPSLGFDQQPLADLPIVPRHLWQGLGPRQLAPPGLPVGSGPYRLVKAKRNEGYDFRANRRYFLGRPRVERIVVPIIRDEERTYTSLQERKVDMLPFNLPKGGLDAVRDATGLTLKTGPLYAGTALLLNLRRPPFDRPAVRRAIAQAIDLERVAKNIQGAPARFVGPPVAAEHGFIHPSSSWASTSTLQSFDGKAARQAVAKLKLPSIRVLAPETDPVKLEAGRQVVLALQRAGGTATLTKLSSTELDRQIGRYGGRSDFDAAIVSIPALVSYDPDFLATLFGSDPRTAPLNNSGYRSSAFDALADRVARTSDRKDRRKAVAGELRRLASDLPAVPLFFSPGAFVYRPGLYDGWVFIKGSGIFDKRSFLPGGSPARGSGREEENRDVADAADETGSGSSLLSVLGWIGLVVLAGGLIVAAVAGVVVLRQRLEDRG